MGPVGWGLLGPIRALAHGPLFLSKEIPVEISVEFSKDISKEISKEMSKEISNEMSDVEFGVLDIDSQPNSPIRPEFSVRGIPSCFLVKSGSVVGSKIGMTNKQDFVSWIKENI